LSGQSVYSLVDSGRKPKKKRERRTIRTGSRPDPFEVSFLLTPVNEGRGNERKKKRKSGGENTRGFVPQHNRLCRPFSERKGERGKREARGKQSPLWIFFLMATAPPTRRQEGGEKKKEGGKRIFRMTEKGRSAILRPSITSFDWYAKRGGRKREKRG